MTREETQALIHEMGGDILASPGMDRMRTFTQHGTTSVCDHCTSVAAYCLRLDALLPGSSDRRALVRGTLLHDYFLYDWHDRSSRHPRHATMHPLYALENAERDFELSPTERNMIASHMFPLPPTRIPRCREAWILTLADKGVSFVETVNGFLGK